MKPKSRGRSGPVDVVTGGAGFIGSHVAEALLGLGRGVRVIDDLSAGDRANVPEGAEFLEGDLLDLAPLALGGADVVYHLAAVPSVPHSIERPLESHRSNVEATLAVLAEAERAGVRRVVFASSSAVYGDAPGLPRRERQDPAPRSPYAVGKLCGEHYARYWAGTGRLETVSLRFFNVYGPRQDPRSPYAAVIPLFLERLHAGEPLVVFGDGHQTRDFTCVSDVARGMTTAGLISRLPGPCYNVASGRPVSVLELAETLARRIGRPLNVRHAPPRPGDVSHSWADTSAARRELGFEAKVPLEDGLGWTVEWFRRRSGVAAGR